jgi:hypothetical protein
MDGQTIISTATLILVAIVSIIYLKNTLTNK